MMNSGTSAIFGIGNSAETTAIPGERASDHSPTASPTAMPKTVPSVQPIASRASDADRCRHNSPLIVSATQRAADADRVPAGTGVGIKPSAGAELPERDQHEQRRRAGQRVIARREAAAAERHRTVNPAASTISRSAAAASSRIMRHSSASTATRSGIARLPPGQRAVDAQHLAHAPGPARQHDDLLTQPHRLGQIVRDIDRGGAGARDQRGELVQQQVARLRVQRRQRLVHQQARPGAPPAPARCRPAGACRPTAAAARRRRNRSGRSAPAPRRRARRARRAAAVPPAPARHCPRRCARAAAQNPGTRRSAD